MADNREARKQPIKLEMSQGKHVIFLFGRPFIFGFFEALVPKSKACFIPVQHFDFIALFVGEQEQCAAAQGQVGVIFDNRSEAVDGLSKIDAFAIEIDFGSTEHTFHDSTPMSSAR